MEASNTAADTEIVVHISAPSKTSDDAMYRALGDAYQNFQSDDDEDNFSPIHVNLIPARRKSNHGVSEGSRDKLSSPGDQAACTVSESQDLSFQSAIDNLSSPRWRRDKSSLEQVIQDGQNEPMDQEMPKQDTLPSQIKDSYPMPSQSLRYTSPTRMLQDFITSSGLSAKIFTSSPSSYKRKRSQPRYADEIHSYHTPAAEVPSSIPEPSSQKEPKSTVEEITVIAVTPYPKKPATLPANLSEARQINSDISNEIHPDITHISSSTTSQPPLPDLEPTSSSKALAEPASKRLCSQPSSSTTHLRPFSSSPILTPTNPPQPPTSTPLSPHLLNALEIRPPSPPPSTSKLDSSTLIPPKLAKLAVDLSSRYRPTTTRPINDLERGYWLMDCTTWSDDIRLEAWVFLTQYVGCGLAGWGVWCTRGEDRDWVRLYCWGCAVKHTYLLMYLASGRRMKLTGAKWMDAGGEQVVEVLGTQDRM